MPIFALATLTPLALTALAAVLGGPWAAAALFSLTLVIPLLDRLAAGTGEAGAEFPAGTGLSVLLAAGHFALLALVVRQLGTGALGPLEGVATFLAAAIWMGQVSNANAHELIHRPGRGLRRLGTWVFISLLFGHHASAHPLVHHVHVATPADPNTARRGESFYRFAPRAWRGSFREGLRAERRRLARRGQPRWRSPYVTYGLGALAMLGLSVLLAGPAGLAIHLGLALLAQAQLLMSDYVQHYGLRREILATGKPVPVGPGHSWNSPHPASSALLLNAPRHSDHHVRPGTPWPGLRLEAGLPTLPRPLPVMGVIALAPGAWRRIMHPRLDALTKG